MDVNKHRGGTPVTLADYAKHHNIARQTIHNRLSKSGLTTKDLPRDANGDLTAEAVEILDNALGYASSPATSNELDATGRQTSTVVQEDGRDWTRLDAELIEERTRSAALQARVTALEEALANTRGELEKAQEALATSQATLAAALTQAKENLSEAMTVASQAQQLQAQQLRALGEPDPSPRLSWWKRVLKRT